MAQIPFHTIFRGAVLSIALGAGFVIGSRQSAAADAKVDYAKDIKPIFDASCVKCHSLDNPRKKAASGFRLDDQKLAMKGGSNGADIVPGHADQSLLYKLLLGEVTVNGDEVAAMPKAKKGEEFKPLSQEKIDMIKSWIDQGAEWGK